MLPTLNERIRELRKNQKLTQQEMADRLDVKQPYYSDIENGRRAVTNKFIDKIIAVFKVSKDWIYNGKGITTITKSDIPGLDNSILIEKGVDYWAISETGIIVIDKIISDTLQTLSLYCIDFLNTVSQQQNATSFTIDIEKYANEIRSYVNTIKSVAQHNGNAESKAEWKRFTVDDKIKLLNTLNEKVIECLNIVWEIDRGGAMKWNKQKD